MKSLYNSKTVKNEELPHHCFTVADSYNSVMFSHYSLHCETSYYQDHVKIWIITGLVSLGLLYDSTSRPLPISAQVA